MTLKQSVKLIVSPRMWVVYLLGFISGLPLALTGTTLQSWFASEQMSLVSVGMMTLVGLPYSYKFLWAPFFDRFFQRKTWLMCFQFFLALLLFMLSGLCPQEHLIFISIIALMLAFVSASQDIVIDAYRTEYLTVEERGVGAASFTCAYRLAMLVSGGLGLIVADKMGWSFFFISMGILLLLGLVLIILLPITSRTQDRSKQWVDIMINPFKQFFTRQRALTILCFILFYKIGEAFTLSLSTAFFLNGLHMSLSQIGVMYKGVGFAATLLGAYLGGILLPYLGNQRALLYFGIFQACANGLFVVLSLVGKQDGLVMLTIALDLGSSGMATTALLAYFMSLCDSRYTGAQFALLTAVMAVGRIFCGPVAGFIVQQTNWTVMFLVGFILSLPALFLNYFCYSLHSRNVH